MYELIGIPDGSDWVVTPEPLVDEPGELERDEDVPVGLEVGTEGECSGGREPDGEGDGVERVGIDNDGPGDDGESDE